MPRLSGSPIASSSNSSRTPGERSIASSSSSRRPRKNAGVGISETSPNCSRAAAKSPAGPGKRISASAARRAAPGCWSRSASARRAPSGRVRVRARERELGERLREAGGWCADPAAQEVDHGVGQVEGAGPAFELVEVDPGRDGEQRQIADDLARGRDLDDVAEQAVGALVGQLDLFEAPGEPDGVGLLAQVGELPAGDLVAVDASGRRLQAGLERAVERAHRLPVRLLVQQRVERDARVALGRRGRGDDRRERRLAGHPGDGAAAPSTASTPASIAAR